VLLAVAGADEVEASASAGAGDCSLSLAIIDLYFVSFAVKRKAVGRGRSFG
jgi:hypothetical protein